MNSSLQIRVKNRVCLLDIIWRNCEQENWRDLVSQQLSEEIRRHERGQDVAQVAPFPTLKCDNGIFEVDTFEQGLEHGVNALDMVTSLELPPMQTTEDVGDLIEPDDNKDQWTGLRGADQRLSDRITLTTAHGHVLDGAVSGGNDAVGVEDISLEQPPESTGRVNVRNLISIELNEEQELQCGSEQHGTDKITSESPSATKAATDGGEVQAVQLSALLDEKHSKTPEKENIQTSEETLKTDKDLPAAITTAEDSLDPEGRPKSRSKRMRKHKRNRSPPVVLSTPKKPKASKHGKTHEKAVPNKHSGKADGPKALAKQPPNHHRERTKTAESVRPKPAKARSAAERMFNAAMSAAEKSSRSRSKTDLQHTDRYRSARESKLKTKSDSDRSHRRSARSPDANSISSLDLRLCRDSDCREAKPALLTDSLNNILHAKEDSRHTDRYRRASESKPKTKSDSDRNHRRSARGPDAISISSLDVKRGRDSDCHEANPALLTDSLNNILHAKEDSRHTDRHRSASESKPKTKSDSDRNHRRSARSPDANSISSLDLRRRRDSDCREAKPALLTDSLNSILHDKEDGYDSGTLTLPAEDQLLASSVHARDTENGSAERVVQVVTTSTQAIEPLDIVIPDQDLSEPCAQACSSGSGGSADSPRLGNLSITNLERLRKSLIDQLIDGSPGREMNSDIDSESLMTELLNSSMTTETREDAKEQNDDASNFEDIKATILEAMQLMDGDDSNAVEQDTSVPDPMDGAVHSVDTIHFKCGFLQCKHANPFNLPGFAKKPYCLVKKRLESIFRLMKQYQCLLQQSLSSEARRGLKVRQHELKVEQEFLQAYSVYRYSGQLLLQDHPLPEQLQQYLIQHKVLDVTPQDCVLLATLPDVRDCWIFKPSTNSCTEAWDKRHEKLSKVLRHIILKPWSSDTQPIHDKLHTYMRLRQKFAKCGTEPPGACCSNREKMAFLDARVCGLTGRIQLLAEISSGRMAVAYGNASAWMVDNQEKPAPAVSPHQPDIKPESDRNDTSGDTNTNHVQHQMIPTVNVTYKLVPCDLKVKYFISAKMPTPTKDPNGLEGKHTSDTTENTALPKALHGLHAGDHHTQDLFADLPSVGSTRLSDETQPTTEQPAPNAPLDVQSSPHRHKKSRLWMPMDCFPKKQKRDPPEEVYDPRLRKPLEKRARSHPREKIRIATVAPRMGMRPKAAAEKQNADVLRAAISAAASCTGSSLPHMDEHESVHEAESEPSPGESHRPIPGMELYNSDSDADLDNHHGSGGGYEATVESYNVSHGEQLVTTAVNQVNTVNQVMQPPMPVMTDNVTSHNQYSGLQYSETVVTRWSASALVGTQNSSVGHEVGMTQHLGVSPFTGLAEQPGNQLQPQYTMAPYHVQLGDAALPPGHAALQLSQPPFGPLVPHLYGHAPQTVSVAPPAVSLLPHTVTTATSGVAEDLQLRQLLFRPVIRAVQPTIPPRIPPFMAVGPAWVPGIQPVMQRPWGPSPWPDYGPQPYMY